MNGVLKKILRVFIQPSSAKSIPAVKTQAPKSVDSQTLGIASNKEKLISVAATEAASCMGSATKVRKLVRALGVNFSGPYAESPDKSYLVAWSDYGSGPGKYTQQEGGSYILAHYGKIVVHGRIQRPKSGKVANNGTFIINDWMDSGKIEGTFYAFDKSGTLIVKHLYSANLDNNGISDDGKYAACFCLGSKTEDAMTLSILDLTTGALINKFRPKAGPIYRYRIESQNNIIHLDCRDLGIFRYNFNGDFLDKEKYEKARLESASPWELLDRIKTARNEGSLDRVMANKFLKLLDKELSSAKSLDAREEANAYRAIGEVHDSLGEIEKAVTNYGKAIALDPKVGVKRRLGALKKQLQ